MVVGWQKESLAFKNMYLLYLLQFSVMCVCTVVKFILYFVCRVLVIPHLISHWQNHQHRRGRQRWEEGMLLLNMLIKLLRLLCL